MSKLITVTSVRDGTGKTTVAGIIAEKLSKLNKDVLIIDNNESNISIYDLNSSSIDSIKLYMCLESKENCKTAIKQSASTIKKNLYFFSAGHELLTEEEIMTLKEQNLFDYIIIDKAEKNKDDISDYVIRVINPNIYEYKKARAFNSEIILINRYTNGIEFKVNEQDFKLYFCPEIINFVNGYELNLPEENETEIKKMLEKITGEKKDNFKNSKFKLFKRR